MGTFGLLQGYAGPADQGFSISPMAGVQSDPDICPGIQEKPRQFDRLVKGQQYLLRQLGCLFGAATGHQYGKLELPNAGDRVLRPHCLLQSAGNRLLRSVRLVVSKRFIEFAAAADFQLQQAKCA
ncbi:hypothetical protein FQZ97_882480 [compost metagenome]